MSTKPHRRPSFSGLNQAENCKLIGNYQRIGSAAINAALACRPKKSPENTQPSQQEARQEA